jgi:hypothetical protein
MAFIEGHPQDKIKKSMISQMGFSLIAGLALLVMMIVFSDDWRKDLTAISTIVGVIGVVMILVLYKLNPLAWKKIFNRAGFEKDMGQEIKVIDKLKELDDSFFIINDFSFELFHVEHLVVSEKGVFVISKIRESGILKITDGDLCVGDKSLETLTGRVWRISHLINLIVKKGFNNAEIMPQPVLVLPDVSYSPVKEYNGIRIAGIDELNSLVTGSIKTRVEKKLAEGFAYFMKQRYMKTN